LEDLAAPDAPWLGPPDRAGKALGPHRTRRAERLRTLQLGRCVGKPQIGVLGTSTGQSRLVTGFRDEQLTETNDGVTVESRCQRPTIQRDVSY
jgi:hypothetical protein